MSPELWPEHRTIQTFDDFIRKPGFPCVAAKSALATGGMRMVVAADLRTDEADHRILSALKIAPDAASGLVSTVVLFPLTPLLSEVAFEYHLWVRLQALYELGHHRFKWDARVSSDPRSAGFAVSIAGIGYFVVGLHPGSSRLARRAPIASLAFNPHTQFRRLKADGLYERLRHVVRDRDIAIQGNANPMLSEHDEVSEARQYSGREVADNWVCPFRPSPGEPT